MIFIAVVTAFVLGATALIWRIIKKGDSEDAPMIVFFSFIAGIIIVAFGFLLPSTTVGPNQINNHTSQLQSLVQQAGGTGGRTYVRVDYVNRFVPDQIVSYAVNGKLIQIPGERVVIRTVDNVKDARVVHQEYFSHLPLYVPWYSAGSFPDRYVIYVPKTAITYGEAAKPLPSQEEN